MAASITTEKHVLWFTGLPSAGKTTIGKRVEEMLNERGEKKTALFFDGDVVRELMSKDLSHGTADLTEHHARVRDLMSVGLDKVSVVVAAFVSPTAAVRKEARTHFESLGASFHEIHVAASQKTVERRDVKGLYKMAAGDETIKLPGKNGEPPYEVPEDPALTLETDLLDIETCAAQSCALVTRRG